MPIITAWSTPGAALIATSAAGVAYENALGAFAVVGALTVLAAFVKPLERAIEKIPAPVAAAMLAGVLLRYALGVPGAALAMPVFVLPLIVIFFALRLSIPFFAVPVVVGLGVAMAAFGGNLGAQCCTLGVTALDWTTPAFDGATILGLGIPLFVTMASQNLPASRCSGFRLQAAGGSQPVRHRLRLGRPRAPSATRSGGDHRLVVTGPGAIDQKGAG
jgi:benzoate membrane transport protein